MDTRNSLSSVRRRIGHLQEIEGKVDIRSYQVRTEDGRVYTRNRRQLRRVKLCVKQRATARSRRCCPQDPNHLVLQIHLTKYQCHLPLRVLVRVKNYTLVQRFPLKQPVPSAQGKYKTSPPPPAVPTRSGRIVRRPARFADQLSYETLSRVIGHDNIVKSNRTRQHYQE